MKIRKKPIIISVLSLVLCLSVVFGMMNGSPAKENIVEVTASIAGNSPMPRVSQTADNVYTFDNGDKIHIVGWYGAWDEYNKPWEMALDTWWNDAVSTYNATSGKWKTEPYMRWQNGNGLQHNFLAWYPEDTITSNDNLTAVDVTVTGDYEKDDILLARWAGLHPVDNVLDLQFEHLMARFDVNLKFRNEYANVRNISIETNLKNKAVYNFLSGVATAQQGEGIMMQENPHRDTDYDWSGTCITVPQDFAGPLLTITFTNEDGTQKTIINYTHPTTLRFDPNMRTTLTLVVGKDKVELEDVTVTDWDEENIDGGEAEEEPAKAVINGTEANISVRAFATQNQVTDVVSQALNAGARNISVSGDLSTSQQIGIREALGSWGDNTSNSGGAVTLTLPDTTVIGDVAFGGCDELGAIVLPKATVIEDRALGDCTNLKSITCGSVITQWGAWVLNNVNSKNITLTLASGQPTLTGNGTNFTAAEDAAAVEPGEGKSFCEYIFKEIKTN